MELELIFTELRPFKLSHFTQFWGIVGYEVCVINSSYSSQWIVLKLFILIVNIMKMCMWIIDGARINCDRIVA